MLAKGPKTRLLWFTMAAEMKLSVLFLLALAVPAAMAHQPPKKVAQAPHWLQKKLKPIVKKPLVALRTL